jgi:type II secretory ATPase GspE/PulE/Tfp pilus assembly ATPase PilB-like protein
MNLAMAQRLLRKLCPVCKKEKTPNESEKKIIDHTLKSIGDKTYLSGIQTEKIYEAVGCDKCNNTGYKGRIAIVEVILSTKEMEPVIIANSSDREIKEAAKPQNLLDMKQDGVLKVLNGISTLDELGRVIDLAEN